MSEPVEYVDHAALRVNQASIVSLLILAFVLNLPWLAAGVALLMGLGTALRKPGFKWLYTGLLKPRGLVRPEVLADHPQPHLFAQGLGAGVLALAVLAFLLGSSLVGWALVWLVVALAALNLFAGFCAGCFVYYWLGRLRLPGFTAKPQPGVFPGMRPSKRAG